MEERRRGVNVLGMTSDIKHSYYGFIGAGTALVDFYSPEYYPTVTSGSGICSGEKIWPLVFSYTTGEQWTAKDTVPIRPFHLTRQAH